MKGCQQHRLRCLGLAIILSMGVSSTTWAAPAVSCDAASQTGGTVFHDYNENGVQDPLEPGVGDVTITAYDANNTAVATTQSGSNGVYVLSGLMNGTAYRVEFTELGDHFQPAAYGGQATNVQFVTASPSCSMNVGVHNPAQYCQANPEIVTTEFVNGDQQIGLYSNNRALASVNSAWGQYATGNDASPPNDDFSFWQPTSQQPRTLAVAQEIGAIYGLAWSPSRNYLYAAAYHKAHAGYGPGGRGQIYRISVDPQTGQALAAPEQWVNVETELGLNVCGDHGVDLNNQYNQTIFDQVGKCSLGDLDLSEDESTLYAMNLTTKSVVGIDTTTGQMTGEWAFPSNQANCQNAPNDVRPFALNVNEDLIYAGAVCSAETSRNKAHLRAYVYTLDPSNGTWTEVLNYDWSKQRYSIYGTQIDPWLATIDQVYHTRFAQGSPRNWVTDNSQMLTDIEFVGNDMVLGFRGRFSDQWGIDIPYERTTAPTVPNALYTVNTVGDVVCIAYDPVAETYTWESNDHVNNLGVCGSRTASASGYVHPNTDYDPDFAADPLYQQGDLDDGEFYWGDGGAPSVGGANHYEISLGGLVQYGTEPLIMTALTPPNALGVGYDQSGGLVWQDNTNGAPLGAYVVYDKSELGTFNKAAGLGDLEALCTPAPVEVGNYVWHDSDGDGIADPDENGLDGVAVQLQCGADNATVTTANGGQYYFTNQASGNAAFMDHGETCSLQIDTQQASLNAYELTDSNQTGDSSNHNVRDLRDSDANTQANQAVVNFTVGSAGENNHSFDFGFRDAPNAPPPTGCVTVTNTVTATLSETDSNTSNNSATADLQINCSNTPTADISVIKTASESNVASGDRFTYTITVNNAGPDTATGVVVTDQLPAGVTYSTHNASQGSYNTGTGAWTVGDMTMGQTATLTIEVSVD